ncbi:unnamed protein product [Gadus morhua 'NCC']
MKVLCLAPPNKGQRVVILRWIIVGLQFSGTWQDCSAATLKISPCVRVWRYLFNRATGAQPHPAPESNQSDSGQVRLLKPTVIHTHCESRAMEMRLECCLVVVPR